MLQWDGAELIPRERQRGKMSAWPSPACQGPRTPTTPDCPDQGTPCRHLEPRAPFQLVPGPRWAVSQRNVAGIKVLSPTWFLFRHLCSVFLEDKSLCLVLCCTWSVLLLAAAWCASILCVANLALWLVDQVQPEQYYCGICYLFSTEGVRNAVRTDFSCTLHLLSTAPAEIWISEDLVLLLSLCEGLPQEPKNLFSPVTTSLPCPRAF